MSDASVQQLFDEIKAMRADMGAMMTAIQGNPTLGVDGLVQHMRYQRERLAELERDVKSLKNDRGRVKAWIAGLTSAGGIGGAIGAWFSK